MCMYVLILHYILICPSCHFQLMKEKHDNTLLIAEGLQQKKLLEKYTRGQKEIHVVRYHDSRVEQRWELGCMSSLITSLRS